MSFNIPKMIRIPGIEPIRKCPPSSVPKLESSIAIKSNIRMKQEYEHKFETDEEIQTEKECERISFTDSEKPHSDKNSFVKGAMGLKGNKDAKKIKSPQKRKKIYTTESIQMVIQEPAKKNKQLSFFHCDSLCIRPNPSFAETKKSKFCSNVHRFSSKQPQTEDITENQGFFGAQNNNYEIQEKKQNFSSEQQCPPIKRSQNCSTVYSHQRDRFQSVHNIAKKEQQNHDMKKSCNKRKKIGIFTMKDNKNSEELSKYHSEIPSALQYCPSPQTGTPINENDFHIVFETEQITQCCM